MKVTFKPHPQLMDKHYVVHIDHHFVGTVHPYHDTWRFYWSGKSKQRFTENLPQVEEAIRVHIGLLDLKKKMRS